MSIAIRKGCVFGIFSTRFILAVFLFLFQTAGFAFAEPVRVSASNQPDFGRIVFSWKNPVTHSLSNEEGLLVLRFGRPIEATYGGIASKLKKFLRNITPGIDGNTVNLRLAGDFDVYSFDSGSSIILEFVEKQLSENNLAASSILKPVRINDSLEKLQLVGVRVGKHAKYTRLVFDWPKKVSYRFKKDRDNIELVFDAVARLNIKSLQSRTLSFASDPKVELSDKATTLTLAIPENSIVRHFVSGTKVVLDINDPIKPSKPNSKELKNNLKVVKSSIKGKATSSPTRLIPNSIQPINSEKNTSKPRVEKKAIAKKAITRKPSTIVQKDSNKASKDKTNSSMAKSSGLKKDQLPPLEVKQLTILSSAKSSEPPADAITLRFDWDEPVGAAVFRRAGNLWVAFDKLKEIDIRQLRKVGKEFIKGIEQMGTTKATVLRLSIKKGYNPSIRRDGLSWLLDFTKKQTAPQVSLIVKAQPNSPVGARLFIPIIEPKNPIGITDPVIGDNIVILPVIPLGHGIGLEYIYPQVGFLPTIQGIVIKPRTDDIRARPMREGVEVTSAGGLKISAVTAEDEENRMKGPLTRILDLEPWEIKNVDSFRPRKHELLYAISRSKGGQREEARLNMARFYFANGFNTEALAVLGEASRERPEMLQDPEFRMIRGGAKFMLGRYLEADKEFAHDELKRIDETAFWRASIRAAIGNVSESALVLKRTGGILKPYPKAIKVPMGQLVLESALAIGNTKRARKTLDNLRKIELSPKEMSMIDYQEGLIMEQAASSATDPVIAGEQYDAAATKWEVVGNSEHQPSRQKAIFSRMELLLKREKMSRAEAIAELEKIRFTWRGDDFEFKLLQRLGTLYLEEGHYRKGLDKLRQAVTHFRKKEESTSLTKQMSDAFVKLYIEDVADDLPPVTAIALYNEFKELTPPGATGDRMIQKLADRLVGVDLLDRAIKLLKAQVQFRLKGIEKARVGAQLTLVHILARQYAKAIKVLDTTDTGNIPALLLSQRRHLRARALMALKQRESALAVLQEDKSRDAELLRAEIFWNTRNWSKASQSLHLLLRESGAKQSKTLDDIQKAYVLNFVIALTLSGNERGLRRARKDFSTKMAESRLKDAFSLVTATTSNGILDYKLVKSRVMEAEKFQTFLAGYRERLKKENLSDLVPRIVKPVASNQSLPNKEQSELASINEQ